MIDQTPKDISSRATISFESKVGDLGRGGRRSAISLLRRRLRRSIDQSVFWVDAARMIAQGILLTPRRYFVTSLRMPQNILVKRYQKKKGNKNNVMQSADLFSSRRILLTGFQNDFTKHNIYSTELPNYKNVC